MFPPAPTWPNRIRRGTGVWRGCSTGAGRRVRGLGGCAPRGELGAGRPGVEERGGGVGEPALAHEVVGVDGGVDVLHMDADRHAHEHVLGALHDLAVHAEEVRALQGLQKAEPA